MPRLSAPFTRPGGCGGAEAFSEGCRDGRLPDSSSRVRPSAEGGVAHAGSNRVRGGDMSAHENDGRPVWARGIEGHVALVTGA